MGVIRGKIWHNREVVPKVVEVNGPTPFIKCSCGRWKSRETGKHIHVETLTLGEFMDRYGDECPDDCALETASREDVK